MSNRNGRSRRERRFQPNLPVLDQLMKNRGWDKAIQLHSAVRECLTLRSVEKVLEGRYTHFEETLRPIAECFGVPVDHIGIEVTDHVRDDAGGTGIGPTTTTTTRGRLKIDDSFATWTSEKHSEFVEMLRIACRITDAFELVMVRGGCVELTFEFTDEQWKAVQVAFAEGRLAALKVISLQSADFDSERRHSDDLGNSETHAFQFGDLSTIGIHSMSDAAWAGIQRKYRNGTLHEGRIVVAARAGYYVETEDGIVGLIQRRSVRVAGIPPIGEAIQLKVVSQMAGIHVILFEQV